MNARSQRDQQIFKMRWVLFWVFVAAFVALSAGTIAMLFFGIGSPTEDERSKLFNIFVAEVAGAILALFYSLFGLRRVPQPPDKSTNSVATRAQRPSTMPVGPIVYYIPPTVAHNDYYARLQIGLETEVDKRGKDVWWRYCPPRGKTSSDIYLRLEQVLKDVRPSDLIVMVPKGLHDRETETRVRERLNEHRSARIVFLDQPPPAGFLRDKRYSFVGVDNRKVGILAAFALHQRLAKADEYKYCVVSGPGGDARLDGFVEGVRFFDSETRVDRFDIGDMDRLDSLSNIRDYITGYTPATSIGIFAGNDETAIATLRALRDRDRDTAFVVGCDSTREMRLIVAGKATPAIATIDTKIRDQAEKTVRAVRSRVVAFQEPELYPKVLDITFRTRLQDSEVRLFWEKPR